MKLLVLLILLGLSVSPALACCTYPDGVFNGNSDDCSDYVAPIVAPVATVASLGSGTCIDCMYASIREANFGYSVEGNTVKIQFATTKEMNGNIIVDGNIYKLIEGYNGTMHYFTFDLPAGEYTIQPFASTRFESDFGQLIEIRIGENKEDTFNGINWAIDLNDKQLSDLRELFYSDEWNDIDIANWNYAIR